MFQINSRRYLVLLLSALFFGSSVMLMLPLPGAAQVGQPTPTASAVPATTTPDVATLLSRIEQLEGRISVLEGEVVNSGRLLDSQASFFSATVSRMEWLLTIFTVGLAVLGIVVAVGSLAFVNRFLEQAARDWFEENVADLVDASLSETTAALESKYDARFAELYSKVEDSFRERP